LPLFPLEEDVMEPVAEASLPDAESVFVPDADAAAESVLAVVAVVLPVAFAPDVAVVLSVAVVLLLVAVVAVAAAVPVVSVSTPNPMPRIEILTAILPFKQTLYAFQSLAAIEVEGPRG
jgi:hypothetical protein